MKRYKALVFITLLGLSCLRDLMNRVVGGRERVCSVDDEKTMTAAEGVMRATGDWVMVHNSYLYYLGRKDRLVKRHGQMLHLDALQHVSPVFLMPLTRADDMENISVEDAASVCLLIVFVLSDHSRPWKACLRWKPPQWVCMRATDWWLL